MIFKRIFLTSLIVIFASSVKAQTTGPETAITVTASASKLVQPSAALINFSITADAETAEQANAKLLGELDSVKKRVNAVVPTAKVVFRGRELSAKHPPNLKKSANNNSLKLTGPKQITAFYAINSSQIEKIDQIVDSCLEGGASKVGEVELLISGQNQISEELAETAAKSAKVKAEKLAESLGVGLGKLVNIGVSDSKSSGLSLIHKKQGVLNQSFEDQRFETFVTLSYEIAGG